MLRNDELRKDEIIDALDAHLRKNATSLSGVSAFEDYYGKRRATPGRPPRESTAAFAPSGGEDTSTEVKSVVKARGRRPTKVKSEPEYAPASPHGSALSADHNYRDEGNASSPIAAAASTARSALATVSSGLARTTTALSPSGQLTTRTPAMRLRRPELPGPPSPADVADVVEYESSKMVSFLQNLYTGSGVTEYVEHVREMCSSVTGIQTTILLLEAFALQRSLMPWRYAFDIPATPMTGSIAVSVPDLFVLLTGYYWTTTLLWAFTSIFIPALFAYFYNLTMRDVRRGTQRVQVARYPADPMTYNVVKALVTWLVYARGVSFGIIAPETADRVDMSIYGGHLSVIIGSGIGALAAMYEATQKKQI